jgi:hypothetical protein
MTYETETVDEFLNNVIHVNFRKNVLSDREQFLNTLAVELDELDFQDFVEAVNNPNSYDDLRILWTLFFKKPVDTIALGAIIYLWL